MTDIIDMTNAPFEVIVKGRVFKARKLSLDKVFSLMQAKVISSEIANGHQVAESLEGEEKIMFLTAMTANLPKGELLNDAVASMMGTLDGIQIILHNALLTDQPDLTLEEVEGFCTKENQDEVFTMVNLFTGMGGESPKKKRGSRATNQAKKKRRAA